MNSQVDILRYLDNVYPELEIPEHKYVTISFNNWCLDSFGKTDYEVGLYKCHNKGGNQSWVSRVERGFIHY